MDGADGLTVEVRGLGNLHALGPMVSPVLAVNVLGDAIRDAPDPRRRP